MEAVRKQTASDAIKVAQAQIFRETFSTVAGKQCLADIMRLCGESKYLAQPPSGDNALYWFGRRDVGLAIKEIMNFTPSEVKAVVKTKA